MLQRPEACDIPSPSQCNYIIVRSPICADHSSGSDPIRLFNNSTLIMQHSPCYLNMAVKSQLRNQKATLDSKRCLNSRSLMIVLRTRMNETPKDFRWALTKSLLPLNLRSISSFIPYGRGPAGALSQLTPHNYKPEFPTAPCLQPDNYENASPSTLSCPTLTSPNMGTSLDW